MKILAIALFCLCARGVSAQEERAIDNFSGVGVRAMGMGGAFAGVADDVTAMYWNPAGLAQITDREMQVSFLRNSRDTESRRDDIVGNSELANTRFGTMGFAYPYPVYRGSLVLAAGFTRIKDFDWSLRLKGPETDYKDNWLDSNHLYQHEGELTLAGVAVAVDVSPKISLGATIGLTSGGDQSFNELDWNAPDGFSERRFHSRETFTDKYERALYSVLGVMIRSPRDKPRYRVGATITTGTASKIRYVYRGPKFGVGEDQLSPKLQECLERDFAKELEEDPDYRLDEYPGYSLIEYVDGLTCKFPDDEFSGTYELSLPFEFGVGASAEALPGLTLAGSLHFAEWSQSEYKVKDDDPAHRAGTSFETQYRDVMRYHIGVEYRVPTVTLDLRAGFYTDPIPFVGPRDLDPVAAYPPIRISSDRRFITLGAGLLLDGVVQVDMAWVGGAFSQVEEVDDIILVENHDLGRIVLGLGYRF